MLGEREKLYILAQEILGGIKHVNMFQILSTSVEKLEKLQAVL